MSRNTGKIAGMNSAPSGANFGLDDYDRLPKVIRKFIRDAPCQFSTAATRTSWLKHRSKGGTARSFVEQGMTFLEEKFPEWVPEA